MFDSLVTPNLPEERAVDCLLRNGDRNDCCCVDFVWNFESNKLFPFSVELSGDLIMGLSQICSLSSVELELAF